MDPQQQQQLAGMAAGMGVAFLLFGVLLTAFFVFLFWRVFTKAGMAGPISLVVLVPGFGPVIALCILAFSSWQVPRLNAYPVASAPAYPPPAYPPQQYPPAGPPTQL